MRILERFRSSLLPRVLLGLGIVLVTGILVMILLETRLTRDELEAQSRDHLAAELERLQSSFARRQALVVNALRSAAEVLAITDLDHPGAAAELSSQLSRIRESLGLGVAHAVDPGGLSIVPVGPSLTVDREALQDLVSDTSRTAVVPTSEGGYAQVSAVPVHTAEEDLVLIAGYLFDDGDAYRMRTLVSGDVFLVADGQLVGTTSTATLDGAPGWSSEAVASTDAPPAVAELDGVPTLVDYVPLAQAEAGGLDAALGVGIPEPLAPLDRSLARNRALGAVLLAAVGLLVGWVASRRLTRPILELADTAQGIATGDLDRSFEVRTSDEIGILAASLERMRRSLRTQLQLIKEQSAALQRSSKRIVTAQDAERRRLAGDLHDGLQQQLVMLQLRVGAARARAEGEDRVLADQLAGEIDRIIVRLRDTAQGIFPSILQDRGLGAALFSLASRSSLPIQVRLDPDPLPRLEQDLETNAYFLISEAVANAGKHAEAEQIQVEVSLGTRALRLSITDDGVGFDTEAIRRAGGLSRMWDRALALGGHLDVDAAPGRGTRVTAVFPLARGSVPRALQEEEHGGDAAVEVGALGESEFAEDRVGVLLDGPLGDHELVGDRGVALPGRHQREDLELPRRQPREP